MCSSVLIPDMCHFDFAPSRKVGQVDEVVLYRPFEEERAMDSDAEDANIRIPHLRDTIGNRRLARPFPYDTCDLTCNVCEDRIRPPASIDWLCVPRPNLHARKPRHLLPRAIPDEQRVHCHAPV